MYKCKTKPYEHQAKATNFFLKNGKYGALFMEQGTGKTKTAIDIVNNLYDRGLIDSVLLIAPNGVHEQWLNEQLPEHSFLKYHGLIWDSTKSKQKHYGEELKKFKLKKLDKIKWLFANVETFSTDTHISYFKEYVKNNRCAIIVDESTRIKNSTAKRTQNIIYGLKEIEKIKKRIVRVTEISEYRYILTGTMITNSPYDLYSMFEFLKSDYFKMSFFGFRAKFGIEKRDRVNNVQFNRSLRPDEAKTICRYNEKGMDRAEIVFKMGLSVDSVDYILDNYTMETVNNFKPYKNLEELKRLIEPVSFIIRKKDCLDLPEKIYEKLIFDMSKEQRRIYSEMQKELFSEYAGKELSVQNKISLMVRLQQIAGGYFPSIDETGLVLSQCIGDTNPRIKVLLDDLDDTGCNNDRPVIIISRFVSEIKGIHSEIRKAYPDKISAMYFGEIGTEDRKEIIEKFKAGNIDFLIANQRTIGTGFNLQNANVMYFFSNSFSLEDRLQTEDRIHRSGQTESCVYKDIIAKGSIDLKILESLKNNRDMLEYFRDKPIEDIIF